MTSAQGSRRGVKPEDTARWVFNRVADVYPARPPYPDALIDELAALIPPGGTVGDVGAGIGNIALPLAERGFDVVAVEPAETMLARLRSTAAERGLSLRTFHAAAESMPLPTGSLETVVIADTLHFLHLELTAKELFRVLARRGTLAVVTVEFGSTPYMQKLAAIVERATERRPRSVAASLAQLSALVRVPLRAVRTLHDETPMDAEALDRVLASMSFVGPAMNAERFAALRAATRALDEAPVWARTITLHAGRKTPRARPPS
ncbi:MAG TPA: class I SAM-dependent methyltransferase [Polyangiaceae bacterium]|jgi:ubiquinone/menaquinone biosynthesis C-methylase UbiE|nr:class I SAM-dependent methyltransferase [Polyangiaceae bacterium]